MTGNTFKLSIFIEIGLFQFQTGVQIENYFLFNKALMKILSIIGQKIKSRHGICLNILPIFVAPDEILSFDKQNLQDGKGKIGDIVLCFFSYDNRLKSE